MLSIRAASAVVNLGSAGAQSKTYSRKKKNSNVVIKNVFLSFSPDIIHHIIESNELNFSVGQGHHFENQHMV